jgi:hypothetical protein
VADDTTARDTPAYRLHLMLIREPGILTRQEEADLRALIKEHGEMRAKLAKLGDKAVKRLAKQMADQSRIKALSIRNGVATLEMDEARELCAAYVGAARTMLTGAENYSETRVDFAVKVAESPERYVLTVQRAEAERDQLRAQLADVGEIKRQWGTGADASNVNYRDTESGVREFAAERGTPVFTRQLYAGSWQDADVVPHADLGRLFAALVGVDDATPCLTPGAQYAIAIHHDRVQVVVTGTGFQTPQTETDARLLEDRLHDAVEAVLARHWDSPADATPNADLDRLAVDQGVKPVTSVDQLTAPEDERLSDEEFAAWTSAWQCTAPCCSEGAVEQGDGEGGNGD